MRRRNGRLGAVELAAIGVGASLAMLLGLATLFVVSRQAHSADQASDDSVALAMLNRALENEPSGSEIHWSNPATGSRGLVVVTRSLEGTPNRPCRAYRRTRLQPGGPELIEGVGCREGPSRWDLEEKAATRKASRAPAGTKSKRAAAVGAKVASAAAPPDTAPDAEAAPKEQPRPFVAYTMPVRAVR